MTRLFIALSVALLLVAADPLQAAHAAAKPTAMATVTATSSATPTMTPSPSPSPSPSPTASPTPPPTGPKGSSGFCLGFLGCFSFTDLLGSLANGLVTWLFHGLTSIIASTAGILTGVVRPDQWPSLAGFLTFMVQAAGGVAGTLAIIGALRYYRGMAAGGGGMSAAGGLVMLQRTLEAALLLLALPWGIGQIMGGAQAISDAVSTFVGQVGASSLLGLLGTFTSAVLDPFGLVLGVIAFVLTVLLLLVKFASVAVLAWLVIVAPLAAASWPLGGGILRAWFRAIVSVALWGAAWAVWLGIVQAVLDGYSVPAPFKPFVVVALLFFGYGIPRAVGTLMDTGIAAASGAYGISGAIVGLGAMAARMPAGPLLQRGLGALGIPTTTNGGNTP